MQTNRTCCPYIKNNFTVAVICCHLIPYQRIQSGVLLTPPHKEYKDMFHIDKKKHDLLFAPCLLWMDNKHFESHLSVFIRQDTKVWGSDTWRRNITSMRSMTGGLGLKQPPWPYLQYSLKLFGSSISIPIFGSTPGDLHFFQTTTSTTGNSTSNNKKHCKGHSQNKNSCHSHHLTPLCRTTFL